MKIIHTADWHIGQTLGIHSRVYEHQCFFNFLKETICNEKPDALVVSGDIFDTAAPSTESLKLYLHFLKTLKDSVEKPLQVIIISGNHDSAPRLDVQGILLDLLNVKVVGRLPTTEEGFPDYKSMIVPIVNNGITEAVIAAVPFIRNGDLSVSYFNAKVKESNDRYLDGYRLIYQEILAIIKEKYGDDVPVIATGHTFVVSGLVSDKSEVPLFCGNQQAVPSDVFAGFDYVALGHLHKPQMLGLKKQIVYAGSPIPFDFAEKNYRNRLMVVETNQEGKLSWREIRIPRFVQFIEVPNGEPATIDEVLSQLSALPDPNVELLEQYPYLAVHVLVDKTLYNLNASIDQKLENAKYRKIKCTTHFIETNKSETKDFYQKDVQELTYDDAFKAIFKLKSPDHSEPTQEDLAVYHEIVALCQKKNKED